MRQIVLDTETTGLTPEDGHRIIEIGCVELKNRQLTGNRFHLYINPKREIDAGAAEVHGLTNSFLADKPVFADIVGDLIGFLGGAELIIHNAPFDVAFLDHELRLLEADWGRLADYCAITDTLVMAKRKHPGQRNSLDALCKRYGVDNSHRELHGALLDAEILAQVYLCMTGGQVSLSLEPEDDDYTLAVDSPAGSDRSRAPGLKLRVIRAAPDEIAAHEARLAAIDKTSGGSCVWLRAAPDSA
jgi:DNA polymerase-3 subunit epsilon